MRLVSELLDDCWNPRFALVLSREGVIKMLNASHHAFDRHAILECIHEYTIKFFIWTNGGLQSNVCIFYSESAGPGEDLRLQLKAVKTY